MKKSLLIIVCLLFFLLSGCGPISGRIETLIGWSFQYNEEANDYSVFFGLLDEKGKPLAAEVDVDIRIVNDADEVVYTGTRSVSANDYGYYTSQIAGEQYLANVRIPVSEISQGKSSNGKVFLTVYKADTVRFDEVNCEVLYCLPIQDVQVLFDDVPCDLKVKDYLGNTTSVIRIQNAECRFDKEITPTLSVTISGEKISGSNSFGYDMIRYKLYDSDGYLVDSGDIYLKALTAGDRFKDDSIVIYDVTPGETYTLKLMEYSW